MEVIELWKNCWLWKEENAGEKIDSFWITCTEEEAHDIMLPRLSTGHQKSWLSVPISPPRHGSKYYFLITRDGKHLKYIPWRVYVSGIMKGNHRYQQVDVTIQSLDEIQDIPCE